MKTRLRVFSIVVAVLISSFFVLSTSVFASVLPEASFDGTFNYYQDADDSTVAANDYLLEFSPLNISNVL